MIKDTHPRFLLYGLSVVVIFSFLGIRSLLSAGSYTAPSQGGLPNEFSIVQKVANEHPDWLANMYDKYDNPNGTWQFLDEVVKQLHNKDPRWVYNGKRGNPKDPSADVVAYYYGSGTAPTANSINMFEVHAVDIMTYGQSVHWSDIASYSATPCVYASYLYPRNAPMSVPELPETPPSCDGDGGSNPLPPSGPVIPPIPKDPKIVDLKDVVPTKPTSTWGPNVANGWWPNLSPDGKYVAYGNWGDSFVTDLQTKQTWNFKNPADLTVSHRCIGGAWIKPDTLSFVCEIGPAADRGKDGFYRYEVKIGEWIPKRTADDPRLVAGNFGAVKDGHWVSLATGRNAVKDNKLLENSQGTGSPSISGDTLVTTCEENESICVWDGFTLSEQLTASTPVIATDTYNGYIAYAGYDGSIHGITPDGNDIDLSATQSRKEALGKIVEVNGKPWIATTTCINTTTGNCVGLIRPWGERKSIVVGANAPYGLASIVYANNNFIVGFTGDRGQLVIQTIPADSPRVDLCGDDCTDTGDTSSGTTAIAPFPPQTTLPVPDKGLPTDLGQMIGAIFIWSLGLIGLVIFVRFFYAGFLWFTAAANAANVSQAKEIMKNAVYGTLVLFSAWLILNTINPDLVSGTLNLPGLPATTESSEGIPPAGAPPSSPTSCNQKFTSITSSTGCATTSSCTDVSSYTTTHGCESNGGVCLLSSQAATRAKSLITSFNTLSAGKSCTLKISSALQTNNGPSASPCHKPNNAKSGTCVDFNIIGDHNICSPYFYKAAKDTGSVVSFLDEYVPTCKASSTTGGNIHVNF